MSSGLQKTGSLRSTGNRKSGLMDLFETVNSAVSFLKGNPVIAVIVALFLVIFIYRRPKLFFGVLFLALILAAAIYLIMGMASSGSLQKGKLIHKEEKQIRELK